MKAQKQRWREVSENDKLGEKSYKEQAGKKMEGETGKTQQERVAGEGPGEGQAGSPGLLYADRS